MIRARAWIDRAFTVLAFGGCILVVVALVGVLAPIFWKGAGAVVFRGTVEFRKMRLDLYGKGDPRQVQDEIEKTNEARRPVYEMLDKFERGINTEQLEDKVKTISREFGRELRESKLNETEQLTCRDNVRHLRDMLIDAFESTDRDEVLGILNQVAKHEHDKMFEGTIVEKMFAIARDYADIARTLDLKRRDEYGAALSEVRDALRGLFGPPPGQTVPALIMDRYGATRMDIAAKYLEHLMWAEKWVSVAPGKPLEKKRVPRAEQFAGTELAPLFPLVQHNLDAMLRPHFTVYWRYFLDDSVSSHFFGGVGPEIMGTLLITLLTTVIALPLGVISAAWLVETGGDNPVVTVIRVCVNTLAGVPSIVFGLFGLAFFVLFLLPRFGFHEGSSILAGSLTLVVLVLPIIIRASEEAIRTVPRTWKEAALALGAGRFRTFVTVTLPAAVPGIMTGVILSMSRAAGETAPILFTAAVALGPVPTSLSQPTRTLSYGSYDIAVGDRIAQMAPHKEFGMVMTLVLVVLALNITAIIVRARTSRKLRGG